MNQIQLGNTDIAVSQLIFGCWGIVSDFHWADRDEADSVETIEAALEAGVNTFDTAEAYGDGASEELLGKLFEGRRDDVILASKVGAGNMREADVIAACERSLGRLRTDRIDLYQTHWFADRDIPIDESWGALQKLRDQGKVRAIGVCNAGVEDTRGVCEREKPVTNQLPYNLLWRALEDDVLPECRKQGIDVIVYSPLMHGLLAGKYRQASDVPDGRARSRHFRTERSKARHGESGCEEETFEAIAAVGRIAREAGRSMADIALAWLAAQPGISCIIAGASSPAQLRDNIAAIDNPLSGQVAEKLSAATESLKKALGPNLDMWQGQAGSRFR